MPNQLRETVVISEAAAAQAAVSGRMLVQFISPGWGSSGYYSPEVISEAAVNRVIPAGTHMYADHPTDTEVMERPERSIRDLMAVTTEDAQLSEDGALVGEVRVFPTWRDLLADEKVRESIGVSIRGDATDITQGTAEGRTGRIIEGLAHVSSVDFVTRAGRGGKVLSLLESAANRRAVRHGIAEATVNDTREALLTLLRDTYGADKTYIWVRDFDESTVWFEIETEGDGNGVYGQTYSQTDAGAVALSGDRTEVRVSTTYVPVTRPGSTTTTTESHEETQMGTIPIEESVHKDLVEKAGRVETLESERDTAVQERETEKARADQAEARLAERDRADAARKVIDESDGTFTPLEVKGLLADLPLKEGELDVEAFKSTVDEAAAKGKTRGVHGFGGTIPEGGGEEISEADLDKSVASIFGRTVKEA